MFVNPNQIRAYGVSINNNSFNASEIGINAEELFISFNNKGAVVHFKSHVRIECKTTHLPVILIRADSWDPTTVDMSVGKRSREDAEMRMIRSLKSSMSKQAISVMLRDQSNSRQVRFWTGTAVTHQDSSGLQ